MSSLWFLKLSSVLIGFQLSSTDASHLVNEIIVGWNRIRVGYFYGVHNHFIMQGPFLLIVRLHTCIDVW